MRQKLPSKTSLARQAKACVFNPRAAGPMKVIAENGNVLYYEDRAVECIKLARELPTHESRAEELRKAIGLLLLSLERRNGTASENRTRGDADTRRD